MLRFNKISFLYHALLPIVILTAIISLQFIYDAHKPSGLHADIPEFSLPLVKALDLGLHTAAAGYYWTNYVIFEAPFLKYGLEKYQRDLNFINNLDPHFSFPYYWTALVLPNNINKHPGSLDAAINIAENGVRQADPDWRLYFYLAVDYYLYKHDYLNAAKYFDLASRISQAPPYIKRFSINFGIATSERQRTKEVWRAIANSSDDPDLKKRAEIYVARLDMIDIIEKAATIYKQKYGQWPQKINDFITAGILPAIPQDPLGYQFEIYNGTIKVVQ